MSLQISQFSVHRPQSVALLSDIIWHMGPLFVGAHVWSNMPNFARVFFCTFVVIETDLFLVSLQNTVFELVLCMALLQ